MKRTNLIFSIALVSAAAMFLPSCVDLSSVNARLDTIENEISELQTAVATLRHSYNEGKHISSVKHDGGCWEITFSDNEKISIREGIITSVLMDEESGTVTIIFSDGTQLQFEAGGRNEVSVSSIVVLDNDVKLPLNGTSSVRFVINPSDVPIDLISGDVKFELNLVDTKSSYVTAPELFCLKDVRKSEGGYIAEIADTGKGKEYSCTATIVLSFVRPDGGKIMVSSDVFKVSSSAFGGVNTGLPFVVIDTPDATPITSKEIWMEGARMTIYNPDLSVGYEGTLSIKGRGNSTWTQFPKKPYALKLDKKSEIFGMAKHKRWCLLANFMDRTIIRNDVAFEISRRTGLEWTPSGCHVELFLNGKHQGNYYLCEQVKVDPARVNIAAIEPEVISGDDLTGGYLFELDAWFDEVNKFRSELCDFPWQFKDPDEVNSAQFAYGQKYVNDMESSLKESSRFAARDFVNYMDLATYADYWIVYELTQNSEAKQAKSVYMYKDRLGKMKAGPVWDFDWGTFPVKEKYNFILMGEKSLYYEMLFKDVQFKKLVKERWGLYKAALATIPDYIDSKFKELEASDKLNIAMWPINRTTNGDETLSYKDALERMKTAYMGKYDFLDKQIATF